MFFNIGLLPFIGADILSLLDIGKHIAVDGKVLDRITADIGLLYTMKDLSVLNGSLCTLSLRTAFSILMFMNLSTLSRVPL